MPSKTMPRRTAEGAKLKRSAKEELERWKAENGITAILHKSKNQKGEMRLYRKRIAAEDASGRRGTFGPASEVRKIKVEK